MPLTCPNTPANMPRCGVWSFETNTAEGWIKGDPSDPAITGKTTIAVGTAKKVDGSRALVVTTTIPGGENPNTFDYEQQITFEAPLSGMSMNPARTFGPSVVGGPAHGLWLYFVAPPLGMLAAAAFYVRVRGRAAVHCARLYHAGPCLFCEPRRQA